MATISFSSYTSDFSVDPSITNQINATPPNLSNFPMGVGTVSDTGYFSVTGSTPITALDVNEVDGFAYLGTVTLTVDLYTGSSISTPGTVMAVLYSESASGIGVLTPPFQNNALSLSGTHLVTYTATFAGLAPSSLGYLGGFSVDAYQQAVPEPAAYAALGIGIIGLLARRRRGGK